MAGRSVNKVILIGHLGRDAETKYTTSGVSITRFSVATSRRWKDQQTGDWKEETDWTNVSYWRAENVAPYLTKGKQVYIEGRLQTRSYDDKDGVKKYSTEVVVEELMLLGGRGDSAGGPAGPPEEFGASYGSGGFGGSGGGGMVSQPRGAQQRSRPAAAPQSSASGGMDDPFAGGVTDDDVPF
ncbi:MAG: single-stranded DNA-binding protein [Acidobacteria bacterium]|nr:single-stranded DNA-binding protein [Acidobacteriota bacterium]